MSIGLFRIYFNRHGAAPLVWCVATDDFELAVSDLEIAAPVRARYVPKQTPDDEDGKPSAWLECSGTLTLRGSTAVIETETPTSGGAPQSSSTWRCRRCHGEFVPVPGRDCPRCRAAL